MLSKGITDTVVCLSLFLGCTLSAGAQATKVDAVRLVKPAGSASRLFVTNGSTLPDWVDAAGFFTAGSGISITGNTIAATGGGDIVNGGNTGAVVIGTNNATTLGFETNNVVRAAYTGGASTGGALTHTDVTANTSTLETNVTKIVNSSGTAAAGFGQRQLFQLESSTTNAQDAASIDVLWTTATHASRTADMVFSGMLGGTSLAETFRIAGGGVLTSTVSSPNTTTIGNVLTLRSNSNAGVGGVGFGSGILFQGESSTTNNRDMSRITTSWTTATDASRASKIGFSTVTAAGALTESFSVIPTGITAGISTPATITNAALTTASAYTIGNSAQTLTINSSSASGSAIVLDVTSNTGSILVGNTGYGSTTLSKSDLYANSGYSASSGTGSYTFLNIANAFTMSSTASGVQRGIWVNPTLNSMASATYRGIDISVSNASAKGIYQSGTSTTNNFAGNTAFGSTSAPAQSADFYGNVRLRALRMEDYATLTGTGTVTASTTISDNLYKPGSTQATLTLNLPGSPTDMQICSVGFGDIVTALTVSGNGSTLNGTAPTTAAVGDSFAYKFYSGTGWIKIK